MRLDAAAGPPDTAAPLDTAAPFDAAGPLDAAAQLTAAGGRHQEWAELRMPAALA